MPLVDISREINMKKTKFILLTAVVLSLLMAACGGDGGDSSSGVSGGGGPAGPIQLKDDQYGDFKYGLNEAGDGIVITGYKGTGGKVSIPAKIENVPVVEIGEYAFRGRSREKDAPTPGDNITSVVIPDGVRKIGRGAFSDCRNLIDVTLPDTVEEIMEVAFRGCIGLQTANIPARLRFMGLNAFYRDGELGNLTIPAGMTPIEWQGWNHFSGCVKLPAEVRQRLKDLGYPANFN